MKKVEEIAYAPEHGVRGLGDLYLPDEPRGAPAALVIHGGGWNAMDKHGLAGIAELVGEQGFGAYNINYRLLSQAPWPACGDDCLRAARFLLAGGHPAMRPLDRSRLVVVGASAGGHLALMTALRLPPAQVRAVVSIAGPADLKDEFTKLESDFASVFFGTRDEVSAGTMLDASPIRYVKAGAPPLLCVHSTNDRLVPIEQSRIMIEAYRRVGARAELFAYPGPGEQHGIWIEGTDPHRLLPQLDRAIADYLKTV